MDGPNTKKFEQTQNIVVTNFDNVVINEKCQTILQENDAETTNITTAKPDDCEYVVSKTTIDESQNDFQNLLALVKAKCKELEECDKIIIYLKQCLKGKRALRQTLLKEHCTLNDILKKETSDEKIISSLRQVFTDNLKLQRFGNLMASLAQNELPIQSLMCFLDECISTDRKSTEDSVGFNEKLTQDNFSAKEVACKVKPLMISQDGITTEACNISSVQEEDSIVIHATAAEKHLPFKKQATIGLMASGSKIPGTVSIASLVTQSCFAVGEDLTHFEEFDDNNTNIISMGQASQQLRVEKNIPEIFYKDFLLHKRDTGSQIVVSSTQNEDTSNLITSMETDENIVSMRFKQNDE